MLRRCIRVLYTCADLLTNLPFEGEKMDKAPSPTIQNSKFLVPFPFSFPLWKWLRWHVTTERAGRIFGFQVGHPWLASTHNYDGSLRSITLAASGIYIPVVWCVCVGLDPARAGCVDEIHFVELNSRDWQVLDDQPPDAGSPAFQRGIIR